MTFDCALNLATTVDSSLKTEEWLTSEETAAYLKVSVGTLRNLTSNGQIPYYKLGSRNRYRIEDLRNLLLSQKRGGTNGN
jgi:excisionase family DNA binding protein